MSIAGFIALGAAGVPGFSAFVGRADPVPSTSGAGTMSRRARGSVRIAFVPVEGTPSNYFNTPVIALDGAVWHSREGVWTRTCGS